MMKRILKKELLFDHVRVASHHKEEALFLIGRLCAAYAGVSADEAVRALERRERLGSTDVGGGIAVPHARLDTLREPVMAVVRFEDFVEWESGGGQEVKTAVVLMVPGKETDADYLELLSALARKLMDQRIASRLTGNQSNAELYDYLKAAMGAV